MQLTTILTFCCTIAVFSITANASESTTQQVEEATTATTRSILLGGRSPWSKKIDPESQQLFNDYKEIILQKLETTHNVSTTFNPEPAKVATQVVAGILYHYLVKLPSNEYAYVEILDQQWMKELYKNEQNVTVRPKLYDMDDKDVI